MANVRGLDENNVEKKFRGVSGTQESIQSLSLWVIHHKAHHEKIVDIWFKVLKKSQIPHRLVLFYLCNDIVQTSKRKHAVVYKDAFKEVLRDAVLLVKDSEVRPNVERIFIIWGERSIYDTEFTDELVAILNNTKVRGTVNSKLLAEFKPEVLMEKVQAFQSLEIEVQMRERHLSSLRLDSSNLEAVRQLKDKAHGREFTNQFEDCCSKLEEFVGRAQQEVGDRTALIEMLEQSELFYDAQFGEAKIVANAYKNFGTRISNLKKKLDAQKDRLPSASFSPLPSPSVDAPSPESSPMETTDIMEAVDMDMSDDDGNHHPAVPTDGAGWRRDSTTTTRAYPEPIPSVTNIEMKSSKKQYVLTDDSSPKSIDAPSPLASPLSMSPSQLEGSLDSSYLPGLALGAPATFMTDAAQEEPSTIPTITDGVNVHLAGGDTPVKDEGSSTPVQDEHDHDQADAKPPQSSMANPIEFLTQLINQGQKTSQASSSFLQGLSALTQTVQAQHQDTTGGASEGAPAWGAWTGSESEADRTAMHPQQSLVPYQHSPLQPDAIADPLQQQASPSDVAAPWPPQAAPEQPAVSTDSHWSPWINQAQPPAAPPTGVPNMPLHQPPAPILPPQVPPFQQSMSQPPSPQLTIPSTPPVQPPVHPPPGPPPPFMMNFGQPPLGIQQSPQADPPPQLGPPPRLPLNIPHPLEHLSSQHPPNHQASMEDNQWGYNSQSNQPYHQQHSTSPQGASPDYTQQESTPQPLIRPRSILRPRLYSHHSDSVDVEEGEVLGEEKEGTIPTIGGSNRRPNIFPPRPPSQPPSPQSAPPRMSLQHRPNEGQQEFIEKLKRKSSLPGTGQPAALSAPPKPNFMKQNLRTLTAIPAVDDEGGSDSSGTRQVADVPANGTGEGDKPAASISENAATPVANIGSVPSGDSQTADTSPVHRPPPPFHGGPPRHEFEHREQFHGNERRNSFHDQDRDRRNSFDRRQDFYDGPPRPRGGPEPYDRRGPPRFYDNRDPYMRPPMKRPPPPPHFDRGGGYFPRY